MPEAWSLARARDTPGGRGAVVAVLDTGVAYENRGALPPGARPAPVREGYDSWTATATRTT